MICLHDTENKNLDATDPFTDILCAYASTMHSTVHTILKATPGQLVLRRDIIFDVLFKAKYKSVLDNRKHCILESNKYEN